MKAYAKTEIQKMNEVSFVNKKRLSRDAGEACAGPMTQARLMLQFPTPAGSRAQRRPGLNSSEPPRSRLAMGLET